MSVLAKIAEWAKELHAWQNDAVRRLMTQDSLADDDIDEIYSMLKASAGLDNPDTPARTPQLLGDTIAVADTLKSSVILKRLHSLKNVNAHSGGHVITFEPAGVTIVYGANGAGKSGYSRVLKRACHAREKKETVLPNVSSGSAGIPEATFDLEVDGEAVSFTWTRGGAPCDHLSQVAVLDAHCVRVFLDEANEVVYLPYGLDIFKKLSELCKALKTRLQSELSSLAAAPEAIKRFKTDTPAGKILHSLKHDTQVSRLETLAKLTADEQLRLQKLEGQIADYTNNSPKVKAERLRRQKRRIDTLRNAIKQIEEDLSSSKLDELREAKLAAESAAAAALLASSQTFTSEPLQSVGSDTWRLMYEAAERYSTSDAYPDQEFPVTTGRCVLCQQELAPEAADRLSRFKAFMARDTAQLSVTASHDFQTKVAAVAAIKTSPETADAELAGELRELSPQSADAVEAFIASAKKRQSSIAKAAKSSDWQTVTGLSPSPLADLAALLGQIESDAVVCDSLSEPAEQAKVAAECELLRERHFLADNLDAIKKHIERLKVERALNSCIDQTATVTITKTGSRLMDEAVTANLEAAVKRELEHFGLVHCSIKLKKTGDYGAAKHQLQIAECNTKVELSSILSEGEQRVLAIASFLAEVNSNGHSGAIVFDDPVSSLDHMFRNKVAKRLVAEGRNRQVIIFTHDIVMLLAVESEAADQQVPLHTQSVQRDGSGAGACIPSKPWECMNLKSRIGFIRDRIGRARPLHKALDPEYRLRVGECYGLLRDAWESAIEEVVFNSTVLRYRKSLETKRLMSIDFTPQDYVTIDRAMSKCSLYMVGHNTPGAVNGPPPTPSEVEADISGLEAFADELRKRQKSAEAAAKALLRPPPTTAPMN